MTGKHLPCACCLVQAAYKPDGNPSPVGQDKLYINGPEASTLHQAYAIFHTQAQGSLRGAGAGGACGGVGEEGGLQRLGKSKLQVAHGSWPKAAVMLMVTSFTEVEPEVNQFGQGRVSLCSRFPLNLKPLKQAEKDGYVLGSMGAHQLFTDTNIR